MSKFHKRQSERKGERKDRENDMKPIRENPYDLVQPEALELPDEPVTEDTDKPRHSR